MRKLLLLLALLIPVTASAESRTFYTWETEDGSVAFTDDATRVPSKYTTTTVTIDGLVDYSRATRSDDGAYADRLKARLSHLRNLR